MEDIEQKVTDNEYKIIMEFPNGNKTKSPVVYINERRNKFYICSNGGTKT